MIYVISDIHGNYRRFRSVLKQIKLKPTDALYILGDVIDRHPDGIKILRWIMTQSNVKMLLGIHEYMMLRALGHPYDEAAAYFGIGQNKLSELTKMKNCSFVLYIGNRRLIKRKQFEVSLEKHTFL